MKTIMTLIETRTIFDKIFQMPLDENHLSNKPVDDQELALFVIEEEKEATPYSSVKIAQRQKEEWEARSFYQTIHKMDRSINFHSASRVEIFIMHAKIIEFFSDNYKGNTLFDQHNPTFQAMTNAQLRTYITWRTKIRNKEIEQTAPSYVLVYIYESINNIGIKNPEEGIETLIWLFKNYTPFMQSEKRSLINWIQDYYIHNQFDISFREIVEKYQLEDYYPSIMESTRTNDYSLNTLCDMPKYKIKSSKIFTEKTQGYILHCLEKVILNLTHLFSLYGTDFSKLLFPTAKVLTWWKPFQGAVYKKPEFSLETMDRTVILSPSQTYILKDGRWKYYVTILDSANGLLTLTYIIKKVESILRKLAGYKYNLKADSTLFQTTIYYSFEIPDNIKAVVLDPLFEKMIEETTAFEFFTVSPKYENPPLPSISQILNCDPTKEPYASFIKIRTLENLDGNTNPITKFHAQALILKDLTDDFESIVPFNDYFAPIYDEMSNDQLRYF